LTHAVKSIQDAPLNNPLEIEFCISAMVARIWAKLSDYVGEYSHNISSLPLALRGPPSNTMP